jgi:hypothetical protein
LVERLLCKQDVSGSSPLTSTESRALAEKIRTQHLFLSPNDGLDSLLDLSSQNLENCIITCQVVEPRHDPKRESPFGLMLRKYTDINICRKLVVKLIRANGGYLGTQRRRRT